MKFWFGKKEEGQSEEVPAVSEPTAATDLKVAPSAVQEPIPAEPPSIHDEPPFQAPPPPPAPRPAPASAANERKALYYQMMNALYDAVLVLDDNGHIVDCNERVESVLGYSRDDLWDASVTEVAPAINAQVFRQMKDGLRDQRRVLVTARCRRKDGTTFHGEIGAGLMELFGENLVLSIRNIEKRALPQQPKKAPVILKTRA